MKISSLLLMPSCLHAFQHHAPHHVRPITHLQMTLLDQIAEASATVLSVKDNFAVIRVTDDTQQQQQQQQRPGGKEEKEEDRVELARALFANKLDMVQNPNGAMADGDLVGRKITFTNNSHGIVVAHRHPIAFVLLNVDASSTKHAASESTMTSCSISTDSFSIQPEIAPGSIVNYMGQHVRIDEGHVHVIPSMQSPSSSTRPIFVPIPKIADIDLINTPLVTGITAIDALTPIGRGQNMLVIGTEDGVDEEEDEANGKSSLKTNKRAWMVHLLTSVVQHNREKSSSDKNGGLLRCFYGLTRGDSATRSDFMAKLEHAGIQDEIVSVVSMQSIDDGTKEDPILTIKALEAAEAVAVAATACTLGEHHALTTGGDALVIIDDINLHKSLWDITTRQLVETYGVDAVVKADLQGSGSSEMRGYFSGLIQRAAKYKAKKGGGSVTLLLLSTIPGDDEDGGSTENNNDRESSMVFDPSEFESMSEKIQTRIATLVKANVPLTAANLKKIQIPIPRPSESEDAKRLALQHVEDLISMSDGQIWFDDNLSRMGRSPPLDPSKSITRVGIGADTPCRADAPALRTVSGSLRFEFAQATDMIARKNDGPTTDDASSSGDTKQLLRRDAFLLAMHQTPHQIRTLSQECVALIAASRGYFDNALREGCKAGTPEGERVVHGLMEYVETNARDTMALINESLDMSLEDLSLIENAIEAYFAERRA